MILFLLQIVKLNNHKNRKVCLKQENTVEFGMFGNKNIEALKATFLLERSEGRGQTSLKLTVGWDARFERCVKKLSF